MIDCCLTSNEQYFSINIYIHFIVYSIIFVFSLTVFHLFRLFFLDILILFHLPMSNKIINIPQSMSMNTAEHPINTAHGLLSEALVLVRRKSVIKLYINIYLNKNMQCDNDCIEVHVITQGVATGHHTTHIIRNCSESMQV